MVEICYQQGRKYFVPPMSNGLENGSWRKITDFEFREVNGELARSSCRTRGV